MKAEAEPSQAAIDALFAGQIYVDRRRNPESAFVIQKVWARTHEDGNTVTRVSGLLITGVEGCGTHDRKLDARSLLQMFPVLKFSPPADIDTEDK